MNDPAAHGVRSGAVFASLLIFAFGIKAARCEYALITRAMEKEIYLSVENGKNGEKCSFSSYITGTGEAFGGAHGAIRGGANAANGGAKGTIRGEASESEIRANGGIFSQVRQMRRSDERRELSFSPAARLRQRRAPSAAAQAGKFAALLACVCVFSLLFALKMANSDLPGETLSVFRSAMNGTGGEEDEEKLGRLHLVQLPGLLSVFAASNTPVAPLFAEQAFTDDSFTASLFSQAGSEIVSMLSGIVRATDPAGEHGGSVTVSHKNGLEITYMGLSEILVERGQPVLQRTAIGRLKGEILYLRVTKDGKPIDPIEFLGTAARVG